MKECAMEPLIAARDDNDLGDFLLKRCTTSALLKCMSEQKRGIVVSPEVYDVLNKMMKNEEEDGSGEVQMLCELFLGERLSYKYATGKTRNIGENVPFAIVRCMQVPFAALLICRMDQGHSLLGREKKKCKKCPLLLEYCESQKQIVIEVIKFNYIIYIYIMNFTISWHFCNSH